MQTFLEEDNNAILTHYLHNYHNGVAKHYEKEAKEYLHNVINYKNEEENLNLAQETRFMMQQLLFAVENVPFLLLKTTLLSL